MDSLSRSTRHCRYLTRWMKVRVSSSLVLLVFLYCCLTLSELKKCINAFGTRCLHRGMEYSWRDEVSNQVLFRETDSIHHTSQIQEHKLQYYGRMARLLVEDPAHGAITVANNPDWRRPIGQPSLIWLKQVNDV